MHRMRNAAKKYQIHLTIKQEIIISSFIEKSDVEQMQLSSSFVPIRIHHRSLNFQTLEAALVGTTYFVSGVSMVQQQVR